MDHGRKRALLPLGMVCYLVALLATAPAGLTEWLLPRFSGGRLHVEAVQGSLWRGTAGSLVLQTDTGAKSLGGLRWRFMWLPLLRGELAVFLDLAGEFRSSHGIVALTPGGVRLRDVDAALPMAVLAEVYPTWKLWQPGGVLELRADRVAWGRNGMSGAAEARWRDASSGLSRINPFGNYRLAIREAKFELATLNGPLRLAGSGEWGARGVRFDGTAQADPAVKAELQDFLRLLGKEDHAGRYRLSLAPAR